MRQEKLSPFLGTLEAALFMPGCGERFGGRVQALKKSFFVPLALFPFSAMTFIAAHPSGSLDETSGTLLAAVYGLRIVVYMTLFLGVMFVLAKKLHKGRDFLRFVEAHNWLDLPSFIITAPLCLAYMAGLYQWEEIYPMLVIATLYGYACLAYAAARIFQLPYELGVSIAAFSLVLNQASLGAVKFGMAQALLYFA
jgi:hypothetical protein